MFRLNKCKYFYVFLVIAASTHLISSKSIETPKMVAIATYDDLKSATNSNNVLIIDVREAQELVETGEVPNSINIPLAKIEDVLKNMSEIDFKKMYGHEKPQPNSPIIFTCRSGRRSEVAYKIAEKLGFNNLKNFAGGWIYWDTKNKE